MDYLKTHTMSYSATAEQYAPYFTRMMSDYSSYYAGAPEGSVMEKDEKWPLIIAAAVMITPIFVAGWAGGLKVDPAYRQSVRAWSSAH